MDRCLVRIGTTVRWTLLPEGPERCTLGSDLNGVSNRIDSRLGEPIGEQSTTAVTPAPENEPWTTAPVFRVESEPEKDLDRICTSSSADIDAAHWGLLTVRRDLSSSGWPEEG